MLTGCGSAVEWIGVRLLYQKATPVEHVLRDIAYLDGPQSDPIKHRLDLFLPQGEDWPVLIFAHGGGWTDGDKSLIAAGADVYGNIGRFYASEGIGTAVINYRLQPDVTWREQVSDLASAVAKVRELTTAHGGDPASLFIMGHSAGAQLAAYIALSSAPMEATGLSTDVICGVIPVSGAGYDLADEKTYDLDAKRAYYEERFRAGDPGEDWLREASAITYVRADAPPFLLIHVTNEWKSLQHQNRLLHSALTEEGAQSRLLVVQGQGHNRMVLSLSRGDKEPVPDILEFVRQSECGQT